MDTEPRRLTEKTGHYATWSVDGSKVYFIATGDRAGDIWAVSLSDGSERPMTNLDGRIGHLAWSALATDGNYLYFVWQENLGDIWMMDVVY